MNLKEKVNIDVLSKLSKLTFTQFKEIIDHDLITDRKENKDDMLHIQYIKLKEYANESYSKKEGIKKEYKFGAGCTAGRLFVQSWGIQKFLCKIRGALCNGIYFDYDMINAQPSILLNICKSKNISCKYLKKYCSEREEHLYNLMDELEMTRGEAKQIFITSMFYKKPIKKNNKKLIKYDFFKNFDSEMKTIQDRFMEEFKSSIKDIKQNEKDNLQGQLMAHILTKYEDIIMRKACKPYKVGVYMFDGFMTEEVIDIEELNTITSSYGVVWAKKEHDTALLNDLEDIDISNNILSYVCKDNLELRAFIMKEKLNDKLLRCNNVLYYKDNLKWITDEKKINITLFDMISDCDLYFQTAKVYTHISPNNRLLKELIEYIVKKAPSDDNFKKWIWRDSKCKLYFKNGYWCFKTNKFVTGEDDKRNTFLYVNRDFKINKNYDIRNDIFKKVFNPIFSIKEDDMIRKELLNYYLYKMARVFAGHIEDKNWFSMEGSRDCGKGMTSDFLKNVFDGYCKTTNSDNFLYKPNMGDSAKNNSFLVDFEFVRLVSINEIPISSNSDTVLCGNKIKKVSSGGDTIQARKNYQDEMDIVLQSSFMFNYNDEPQIKPSDAKEKQIKFYMESKFIGENGKEEFSNISYYKKDDSIKTDFICDEEVMNEMAHIIFEYYNKECRYPQALKIELEDEEENDVKKLLSCFQFTGLVTDTITNTDMENARKLHKLVFTISKIKKMLKGKGAKDGRHNNKRVLKGVRWFEDEEDDEDDS